MSDALTANPYDTVSDCDLWNMGMSREEYEDDEKEHRLRESR